MFGFLLYVVVAIGSLKAADAFLPPSSPRVSKMARPAMSDIQEDLSMRWRIFQESSDYGLKQRIANAIAGEYDSEAAQAELKELIQSAPCVMFAWEASPSCKQAKTALLDYAGVKNINIVRLDDPWSKGNILRAELGKMVGRSSVPCIFIDGEYVGGFDGGVDTTKSPGIQSMAFAGSLRPKLEAAGALESEGKSTSKVDAKQTDE